MMKLVTYEGDYYIELNPKLLRWELYCWTVEKRRFVTSISYKYNLSFKEAKRIIHNIKRSIEDEPYRREWEHEHKT